MRRRDSKNRILALNLESSQEKYVVYLNLFFVRSPRGLIN